MFDFLFLSLFLLLVKPCPLQRCVSMLQTESLRKQCFRNPYWHMRNSENRLRSLVRPSALSGVRRVADSAGDGLAPPRVCNWHQKSRTWDRPVATRVPVPMAPLGEPLRSLCQTLECNTQRVALVLPLWETHGHTIRFRLFCRGQGFTNHFLPGK